MVGVTSRRRRGQQLVSAAAAARPLPGSPPPRSFPRPRLLGGVVHAVGRDDALEVHLERVARGHDVLVVDRLDERLLGVLFWEGMCWRGGRVRREKRMRVGASGKPAAASGCQRRPLLAAAAALRRRPARAASLGAPAAATLLACHAAAAARLCWHPPSAPAAAAAVQLPRRTLRLERRAWVFREDRLITCGFRGAVEQGHAWFEPSCQIWRWPPPLLSAPPPLHVPLLPFHAASALGLCTSCRRCHSSVHLQQPLPSCITLHAACAA